MEYLASIVLVLMSIEIILMPLSFGQNRKPYGYSVWIGAILTALMIAPLCLRVLGIV